MNAEKNTQQQTIGNIDDHSNQDLIKQQNAVVLLSGGLDSVTCLYWAKKRFNKVTAISFNYGQRHNSELQTAILNAKQADVLHKIIDIDIAQLGGSSLTDHSMTIATEKHVDSVSAESSKTTISDNLDSSLDSSLDGNIDSEVDRGIDRNVNNEAENEDIPNTYVPARNTIFMSYAMAVAEVTNSHHIVIGVSSVDYSGYPDCRPEYISAFETMANLATKSGVTGTRLTIQTPLQTLSKAETIKLGLSLGVDYSFTTSCYQANDNGLACGGCDSCVLRKQGFEQAEIADPTRYF